MAFRDSEFRTDLLSLLAQSALSLKSARVAGNLIQYTKAQLMELAQVFILLIIIYHHNNNLMSGKAASRAHVIGGCG